MSPQRARGGGQPEAPWTRCGRAEAEAEAEAVPDTARTVQRAGVNGGMPRPAVCDGPGQTRTQSRPGLPVPCCVPAPRCAASAAGCGGLAHRHACSEHAGFLCAGGERKREEEGRGMERLEKGSPNIRERFGTLICRWPSLWSQAAASPLLARRRPRLTPPLAALCCTQLAEAERGKAAARPRARGLTRRVTAPNVAAGLVDHTRCAARFPRHQLPPGQHESIQLFTPRPRHTRTHAHTSTLLSL